MRIIIVILGMSLNPWTNIDGGAVEDASRTNQLVGGINNLFITIAWSGAAISILIAGILFASRKKREAGKDRLTNTLIIILCISGAVTIVSIIMTFAQSI